mgnify:CR=1 FL=1
MCRKRGVVRKERVTKCFVSHEDLKTAVTKNIENYVVLFLSFSIPQTISVNFSCSFLAVTVKILFISVWSV